MSKLNIENIDQMVTDLNATLVTTETDDYTLTFWPPTFKKVWKNNGVLINYIKVYVSREVDSDNRVNYTPHFISATFEYSGVHSKIDINHFKAQLTTYLQRYINI